MNILFLSALALVLASWLLPNHYLPWPAMHSEFSMAVGLSLLGAFVLRNQWQKIEWPWFAVLILALSFVPLAQIYFEIIHFTSIGVLASIYLLGFSISIVVGRQLVKMRYAKHCLALLLVILYASVISVGMEIYQIFRLEGLFFVIDTPNSRSFANLGQPNQLATLLYWGCIVAIYFWFQKKFSFFSLTIVLVFLGVGLILTQSRSGLLMCCVLVLGLFSVKSKFEINSIGLFLICWVAAIAFGVLFFNDVVLTEGAAALGNERLAKGTRLYHWGVLIDAISRKPYFGYGWGQVANAHVAVALDHAATDEWQEHSHNIIIDLLLWNGVLLGGALVAVSIAWLWLQFSRCRKIESQLLCLAIMGLLVHSLLEYPLEYSYFLFPAGIMIGALAGLNGGKYHSKVSGKLTASLLMTCISLVFLIYFEYLKMERNYMELRFQSAGIGAVHVTAEVPSILILTQLRDLLFVGRASMRPGMRSEDLQLVRDVSSRYPLPPILMQDALAHGLNGDPKRAGEALQILCKRFGRDGCSNALIAWGQRMEQYPVLKSVELPEDRGYRP